MDFKLFLIGTKPPNSGHSCVGIFGLIFGYVPKWCQSHCILYHACDDYIQDNNIFMGMINILNVFTLDMRNGIKVI